MAVPNKLQKIFSNFGGLNTRSSDLTRNDNDATSMANVDFRTTGALSKRKGYQLINADGSGGGYGMYSFRNAGALGGTEVYNELLTVDANGIYVANMDVLDIPLTGTRWSTNQINWSSAVELTILASGLCYGCLIIC